MVTPIVPQDILMAILLLFAPFLVLALEALFSNLKRDGKFPPIAETLNRFTLVQVITMLLFVGIYFEKELNKAMLIGVALLALIFMLLLGQSAYYNRQRDEMRDLIASVLETNITGYKDPSVNLRFLIDFAMEYLDIDYDPKGIANKLANPGNYKRNKRLNFYKIIQALAVVDPFDPESAFLPSQDKQKAAQKAYAFFIIATMICLAIYILLGFIYRKV